MQGCWDLFRIFKMGPSPAAYEIQKSWFIHRGNAGEYASAGTTEIALKPEQQLLCFT